MPKIDEKTKSRRHMNQMQVVVIYNLKSTNSKFQFKDDNNKK